MAQPSARASWTPSAMMSAAATAAATRPAPHRARLPTPRSADVGAAFRAKKRRSFPLGARVRGVRASASPGSSPDPGDDLDVFGFSEDWEVTMVRFWRDWNVVATAQERDRHRVREADIKHLVTLGRVEKAFASPDLLREAAKKLASLLPDAHVPNMFQREPEMVHLNFVRASQSILELQEVLCDVDKCTDVTPVIERHPKLLLCEDVRAEVASATEKLRSLAPCCDAAKAVSEYPELIYRIHAYDAYDELPISIVNIILETSTDDIAERVATYNAVWDEWERERGDAPSFDFDAPAHDAFVSGDYALDPFEAPDASEWMNDGYWEEEE
jgi:hypothetical protein